MLSDEERKAIENLKIEYEKLIKEDNILFPLYKSDAKRLINLIEKQSKEIEELKEKSMHITKETVEFVNSHYIHKDEIKAKIEPRLKELDEQMKKEWEEYGNSREYQDMEDEWNFLQSLLEKE